MTTKRSRPAPSSATHPIAVVAERTGLTQDVLRVWERRYGVVSPVRGPGGQRRYTAADIERLRQLHAATQAGRSIGEVAALSPAALSRLVGDDASARAARSPEPGSGLNAAALVDTALALTLSLDGDALSDHLRRAAARTGVPAFVESVAAPLLRRIGEEWHAGRLTPAHEHLATAVMHDIIVQSMRGLARAADAPRMLVTTLAGDRHAIGAALTGATAAVDGWHVTFLGADLPARDIAAAAIATKARVVALSVIYVDDRIRVLSEIRALRELLPANVVLAIGGASAGALAPNLAMANVRVGGTIASLTRDVRPSAA